jgi:ribonuclease VapC
MVIDTSALLAILKVEPEALAMITRLSQAGPKRISTATLLETRLVIEGQIGEAGQAELDRLLAAAAITSVPLQEPHVLWALEGWRRYGKGRHPAALNFGDCFSYGLARSLQVPLLFKGDDFAATDLEPACPAEPGAL